MRSARKRAVALALLLALGAACRDDRLAPAVEPPPAPTCGDGRIDPGERCDGTHLAGKSCLSEGFDTGVLACSASCTFDTSACIRFCGNGVMDPGEACDGALGPLTCDRFGYKACSTTCQVEASHCVADAFAAVADVAVSQGGATALADLEPRGKGELVVVQPTLGQLLVRPYAPPGGWESDRGFPRLGPSPLLPLALDLDQDGHTDVAAIDADGQVHRALYDAATRGYQTARLFDAGTCRARAWVGLLPGEGTAAQVLVALAACPGTEPAPNALLLLPVDGTTAPAPVDAPGITSAALADLDGDGAADIAYTVSGSRALPTLVRGAGGFVAGAPVSDDVGLEPARVVVADFDGNGRADVALTDGAQVVVLEATEGGLTARATLAGTGALLLAGDVDADGRPDLVWVDAPDTGTATVQVARNGGDFTFTRFPLAAGPSGGALSLDTGDLDGDGDVDVAATFAAAGGSRTAVFVNKVR